MATPKKAVLTQETELTTQLIKTLQRNPFVEEAVSLNQNHITLVLNLTHQATEVFVKSLLVGTQLQVSYDPSHPEEYPNVFIYASDSNIGVAKQAIETAFRRVVHYLEYRDLEKEYAAGYVPRHLSQWLMES